MSNLFVVVMAATPGHPGEAHRFREEARVVRPPSPMNQPKKRLLARRTGHQPGIARLI